MPSWEKNGLGSIITNRDITSDICMLSIVEKRRKKQKNQGTAAM